ncbi:hypothetical protein [Salinisphaera sp. G21_0]|uniref:hypothetical protein n=1 Tax=Salinisphaera sp. G21_0 TaxID=2821094 RepID=UPI001AD9B22E|nr:hypothetical protein [Salinisphaera sp. G21_0]MBO9483788.1 hypothetical protein [Salinisphaera sp. G21_0]
MTGKRKSIDWEAIEADYRAGQLSIRALADKHGTKNSTVRSRAKKEGWERDLSGQVKQAAKNKLSRTVSHTSVAQIGEREIVDQASNEAVTLVLMHRHGIAEYRQIAARLSAYLMDAEITNDNHQNIARSLNSGIDALAKAIKLERQAFNLDDNEDKGSDLAALMDSLESQDIAVE